MRNTNISWAFDTQNFWFGCTKCSAECLHCYIERRANRDPWADLYLTKTWGDPTKWQLELGPVALPHANKYRRIFANSLSDFFDAGADRRSVCPAGHESEPGMALTKWHRMAAEAAKSTLWRDCAWQVIKDTPNLVY